MNIEKIINNVMMRLKWLSEEQVQDLKSAMWIELHGLEITEKSYELAEKNDNSELLKRFVCAKKLEGLSDSSLKQYVFCNNKMLLELNMSAVDVRKADIMYYLSKYQAARKISRVTLRNMKRYISTFYNWLEENEIIKVNPARYIKVPKVPKVIKAPFTDDEMETMRSNAKCKRDRALIEFMYSTGARVSEVVGVNISDIDTRSNTLKVMGKGNKERYVCISNSAMHYLREYIGSRTDEGNALFVHLNRKADRLKKAGIEEIVRTLGREHGIVAHPHKFRHTFATNALDRGMALQNVSQLMGHSNVDTTMLYCKPNSSVILSEYVKVMH